jgi:hypothetical protein
MFIPDEYEGDIQNLLGDIAVIVTAKTFKFSVRVQPVCVDWRRNYETAVLNSNQTKKGFVGFMQQNLLFSDVMQYYR